ncbi:MAG: hypothetical protein IH974_01725 [Myxococcales bacterium]|nr:hypothetical protein [Myxococcales bacterium]
MKLQRIVSCITGVFFAVGFAASQAGAGTGPEGCDFTLEFKALRGGSPTVSVGTKNITAKALIAKGTATSDTTIDVSLVIEALVGGEVVDRQTRGIPNEDGGSLIRLGVGKGGHGDKLAMIIQSGDCVTGEPVNFTATFSGPDSGGDLCIVTKTITKTCK